MSTRRQGRRTDRHKINHRRGGVTSVGQKKNPELKGPTWRSKPPFISKGAYPGRMGRTKDLDFMEEKVCSRWQATKRNNQLKRGEMLNTRQLWHGEGGTVK